MSFSCKTHGWNHLMNPCPLCPIYEVSTTATIYMPIFEKEALRNLAVSRSGQMTKDGTKTREQTRDEQIEEAIHTEYGNSVSTHSNNLKAAFEIGARWAFSVADKAEADANPSKIIVKDAPELIKIIENNQIAESIKVAVDWGQQFTSLSQERDALLIERNKGLESYCALLLEAKDYREALTKIMFMEDEKYADDSPIEKIAEEVLARFAQHEECKTEKK